MMGDPDFMDPDFPNYFLMVAKNLLTKQQWDALYKSGMVKKPDVPKETEPEVSDEELLAILFIDPEYGPILRKVTDGKHIARIIAQARDELAYFLEAPDAREFFDLPPKF